MELLQRLQRSGHPREVGAREHGSRRSRSIMCSNHVFDQPPTETYAATGASPAHQRRESAAVADPEQQHARGIRPGLLPECGERPAVTLQLRHENPVRAQSPSLSPPGLVDPEDQRARLAHQILEQAIAPRGFAVELDRVAAEPADDEDPASRPDPGGAVTMVRKPLPPDPSTVPAVTSMPGAAPAELFAGAPLPPGPMRAGTVIPLPPQATCSSVTKLLRTRREACALGSR